MSVGKARDQTMVPGRENAQRLAQEFLQASRQLSRAIEKVDDMGRMLWPEIANEEAAADLIVIQGLRSRGRSASSR